MIRYAPLFAAVYLLSAAAATARAEILDKTGREAQFVVVTYDPERDSPAEWNRYRGSRGLLRTNWHFLSGSKADTKRIARFLDLDFWHYDEHVMHDFRIVLLHAEGRLKKEIVWEKINSLEVELEGF